MLDEALRIAVIWHTGQVGRLGQPYILHCLRVMFKFKEETDMVCALLHDVVANTVLSKFAILNVFGKDIYNIVNLLTPGEEETYEEYIKRLSKSDCAKRIKIADIKDNLWQLGQLYKTDPDTAISLREQYTQALRELE